mmetsp:Transcript_26419/g.55260  ORF Transcript_26419/g.55260 Transcript_26419/m.55260 type:complete len:320 (-) Transcript_26419:1716-2675(-)
MSLRQLLFVAPPLYNKFFSFLLFLLTPVVLFVVDRYKTFVTKNGSGKMTELGIIVPGAADVDTLPSTPSDNNWALLDGNGQVIHPCCGHELVLPFPKEAYGPGFFFTEIQLNWNPLGHGPPGSLYEGAPHFDFHFYTTPTEERESLIPSTVGPQECPWTGGAVPEAEFPVFLDSCDQFEASMQLTPPEQLPPTYTIVNAVEPGMGNHMIDFVNSPEWNGAGYFTHTWIWGHLLGSIGYLEPMVALEYMDTLRAMAPAKSGKKGGSSAPISEGPFPIWSHPACMGAGRGGMYPKNYDIIYDPYKNEFSFVLTDFFYIENC